MRLKIYQGVRLVLSQILLVQIIYEFFLWVRLDSRLTVAQVIFKIKYKFSPAPLISVVIPVFDRTTVLIEALESVFSQDYENLELIAVADGSPPETLEILRSYLDNPKFRLIELAQSSGTAALPRNIGISNANGTYISFLDSDDSMTKGRLINSVAALDVFNFDVAYGAWRVVLDGTRSVANLKHGQIVKSIKVNEKVLLSNSVICQSSATVRASLFDKAGLIKTEMRYREDHELWLRLSYYGAKFFLINRVLVNLRLHENNNELNFLEADGFWKDKALKTYKQKGPSSVE